MSMYNVVVQLPSVGHYFKAPSHSSLVHVYGLDQIECNTQLPKACVVEVFLDMGAVTKHY